MNPLTIIRKESLDIFNRLHSIQEDIEFVKHVRDVYKHLPLLPNLRCGAWYTDPIISEDCPAYFKSTDGHNNNWSFNLRRSNLHLLDLLKDRLGMILVDSTRSGKRMPDALSKTVPIWCAVVNRALVIRYPHLSDAKRSPMWDTALYTPPGTVSLQEHAQIADRIDSWAKSLAASSFCLPLLTAPLRPVWIFPAISSFPEISTQFLPIICVSASKQMSEGIERRINGYTYVQGSGDDHELWGMGLTPDLFWENRDELINASRSEIPELVSHLVERNITPREQPNTLPTPLAKVQGRILMTTVAAVPPPSSEGVKHLILTSSRDFVSSKTRKYIQVSQGKKEQSHFLHTVLPASMEFIEDHLYKGFNVCVACETGKEASVCVVIAALQLFFDDEGTLRPRPSANDRHWASDLNSTGADKRSIRTRLEWVIASRPEANPSRSLLKRVNEFLLTPPSFLPSPPSPKAPELASASLTDSNTRDC